MSKSYSSAGFDAGAAKEQSNGSEDQKTIAQQLQERQRSQEVTWHPSMPLSHMQPFAVLCKGACFYGYMECQGP